jgi:hypothetical protein
MFSNLEHSHGVAIKEFMLRSFDNVTEVSIVKVCMKRHSTGIFLIKFVQENSLFKTNNFKLIFKSPS